MGHPSRLLGLANEGPSLPIGRWLLGKINRLGTDSAEANRHRHASVARADRSIRSKSTVGPCEGFDRRACVLKPLAKEIRRYSKRLGGLRTGEIQDLAKDIGETVWSVKALKHAEGAADLHFLDQQ